MFPDLFRRLRPNRRLWIPCCRRASRSPFMSGILPVGYKQRLAMAARPAPEPRPHPVLDGATLRRDLVGHAHSLASRGGAAEVMQPRGPAGPQPRRDDPRNANGRAGWTGPFEGGGCFRTRTPSGLRPACDLPSGMARQTRKITQTRSGAGAFDP